MALLSWTRLFYGAVVFVAVSIVAVYYITQSSSAHVIFQMNANPFSFLEPHSPVRACIHPKLKVHDQQILRLLPKDDKIACNSEENWTYTENGTLLFSTSVFKSVGGFTCSIREIKRVDDWHNIPGKIVTNIKNGSRLLFDLFFVDCNSKNKRQYHSIHSAITRKKSIISRIGSKQEPNSFSTKPNVMIIGLDSVSRMSWLRKLPKTHDYFINVLKGIDLESYNIVGDGTPAALLPILTGKNEWELPEARKHMRNSRPVDDHPWIWKQFEKHGYVTHWTEDSPGIATFTYRMKGFTNIPTDFYMRPFYLESGRFEKKWCLGSKKMVNVATDWMYDLFRTYPDLPKFSFTFLSSFSHGSYVLDHVDDEFARTLKELHKKGHLENTVVILMSDHGARFSEIRQTITGKVEERMPYFAFYFPTSFAMKYPEAMAILRDNRNVLSTPFDIHETLLDVVSGNINVTKGQLTKQRGISLFKKIPHSRTCVSAAIPPHWCACITTTKMENTSTLMASAANAAVIFMNGLLANVSTYCETILLGWVESGKVHEPNKDMLKFKKSADDTGQYVDATDKMVPTTLIIELSFITNPGKAHYELTAKYDIRTKTFTFDQNQISRINRYGTNPKCILKTHFDLRSFCYCKA